MCRSLVLIDNDAFVLLAGSGNLEPLLVALGRTTADCRILPSFRAVFRKRVAPGLAASVVGRIESMAERVKPLEHGGPMDLQERLRAVSRIDSGEVLLYSMLAASPHVLLTTNDKASMKALCQDPSVAEIRDACHGRVLSIEGITKKLVEQHGVVQVGTGFLELASRDTFLRVAFSDHNLKNPEVCIETIHQYVKDLDGTLGAGFTYSFDAERVRLSG